MAHGPSLAAPAARRAPVPVAAAALAPPMTAAPARQPRALRADRPAPLRLRIGGGHGLSAQVWPAAPLPRGARAALRRRLRAVADLLAAAGIDPGRGPGAAALCRAAVLPPLPGDGIPALAQICLGRRAGGRARRRGAAVAGPVGVEAPAWGRVELVAEGPPARDPRGWGLVRLIVAPGRQIPHHHHQVMSEWELVSSPGLWGWEGEGPARPQPIGRRRCWPRGLTHGYANPGGAPAGLLCLNRPAFLPDDEVPAPRGAPLLLPPIAAPAAPRSA